MNLIRMLQEFQQVHGKLFTLSMITVLLSAGVIHLYMIVKIILK